MGLLHEVETVKRIAREAGEIILSHYHEDYDIEIKSDESPVTVADKASSAHIVQSLKDAFPEDAVLSEENIPDEPLTYKTRVWVTDPMDGTKEFIKKNGEFAVMIGLADKHRPVLGVVYQPVTGYMYWATKDGGAFYERDGQQGQLKVSGVNQMTNLRVVGSRSHMSRELMQFYKEMGLNKISQSGSVGLKIALIALQSNDLYMSLSSSTSCWDTCAPQIILQEAGGTITNIMGQPLDYTFEELKNINGIVATNGPLHEELITTLQAKMQARYEQEVSEMGHFVDEDQ